VCGCVWVMGYWTEFGGEGGVGVRVEGWLVTAARMFYGCIDDSKDWTIYRAWGSWTRRFNYWFVSHTTWRRGYGKRE
jgi:hypothetical protein